DRAVRPQLPPVPGRLEAAGVALDRSPGPGYVRQMRLLVGAGLAIVLAAVLGSSSSAHAAACAASCGVPSCSERSGRLRPNMDRAVRLMCSGLRSAKLVTPPAHSDISNISATSYGLNFNGTAHDGAPRFEYARF